MAINAEEYKSVIGCSDLYYALVTKDDSTGYTAGTPKRLSFAAEVSEEPKQESKTQYADNQAFDTLYAEGETALKMKVTALPSETLAEITGRLFDAATGRVFDNGGTPPYVALGFKTLKSNGKNKFVWFLKGRFSAPSGGAATRTDSPEAKEQELTYTAIKTIATFTSGSVTDTFKKVLGDEDTTNFSGTGWFLQVQVPGTTTPSALALSSSSPADSVSGVAVTAALTLTFNNALAANEEMDCVLINSSTGAVIAGTNSIDAARKVVTVGHSSNLAAATLHRIVYGVTDIYGQKLTGVVSFTTA